MDFIDVATVLAVAIKWLVYTALLWVMIKVQKLNYNTLGLFASSLAAVLVDLVPYGGAYLSYVVLVIGLWKCTGADIAPDCVFTVIIAGALMFCFNLWVIGLLLGPLRPDLAKAHASDAEDAEMVDDESAAEDSDEKAGETRPARSSPKPSLASSNSVRVAARPTTSPSAPANPLESAIESGLLVPKGVSYGAHPSAMISDGVRVHTVSRGETIIVSLPQGRTHLRCEDITKTHIILKGTDGQVLNMKLP